ncbi:MAG: hypothetical protein MUF50_02030 [Planctomycetes bacterium]|jgi:hypothetical protein|nr:hypothetical protein [Planctomycetota bacterium]
MMNFILGLLAILAGIGIVLKTEAILREFGRIKFFEDHLGVEGGSRLGYQLCGVLCILLGILTMTGLIGGVIGFVLSPLTKYSK